MIGTQPTGLLAGVVLSAVAHEGITATYNGQPAMLAVVTPDGQIVAMGPDVATEARAVAVNNYRDFLKARGHLRTLSRPIAPMVAPANTGAFKQKA